MRESRSVNMSMRRRNRIIIMRMATRLWGVLLVVVVGTLRSRSNGTQSSCGAWAYSPRNTASPRRIWPQDTTTPPSKTHNSGRIDSYFIRHASSKNSDPATTTNDRDDKGGGSNSAMKSFKNEVDALAKKSSWYAVEWFGNVFGSMTRPSGAAASTTTTTMTTSPPIDVTRPPSSIQETLKRIQMDNDRAYFLSGQVDEEIYALDCVFSDPFISFQGRERFVTNLANLGSFITKYDAKVLTYAQEDATTIQTKIMVKLELNLPWKPILAWPWGVKYTVDPETFCIVNHQETWDIDPLEGVKQIFRKPTLRL